VMRGRPDCLLQSAGVEANRIVLTVEWATVTVIVRFVIFLFVSRITPEHGNGRRPNMVGMGKGWPSASH